MKISGKVQRGVYEYWLSDETDGRLGPPAWTRDDRRPRSRTVNRSCFCTGPVAGFDPMPHPNPLAAFGGDDALNADLLESLHDTVKSQSGLSRDKVSKVSRELAFRRLPRPRIPRGRGRAEHLTRSSVLTTHPNVSFTGDVQLRVGVRHDSRHEVGGDGRRDYDGG